MLCWLCKKAHERIDASGCSKLAQEYKRRHDNLSKIIHWKLARKSSFKTGDKSVLKVFEARKCFREWWLYKKYCGISVFRLIMLWKLEDQIWL